MLDLFEILAGDEVAATAAAVRLSTGGTQGPTEVAKAAGSSRGGGSR
jgi:hypothetical protein